MVPTFDLKDLSKLTAPKIGVAICETSLWEFVKTAWHLVEPDPLVPGWHIETICRHLEAVTFGHIRNLVINIPPRHTKSLLVSVLWPAWEWGPARKPKTRWLCMSYDGDLSIRDSVKCRTLLQSPWYRARWGHLFGLMGDQNAKERYHNNRGGQRVSSSVGGMATGEGGDRLVIDDPHNIKNITSETSREAVIQWWQTVMPTRLNNPKKSSKVIIMQRSHDQDLVGHIRSTAAGDYVWLVLPAEFEPQTRCKTLLGFEDPRKHEGELLWPERFNAETLGTLKRELGSYAYAAQFQQRPSPMEGGILKRAWWQYYITRPTDFDFIFQSWDLAFKDLKTSDYVCGQVWGVKGANRSLLDEVYQKLDFVGTIQAIRRMTFKWPKATAKLVEDKANGPAVISALKNEIPGMLAFSPEGSKVSRAFAASPVVEAGNVWLPDPSLCPWVGDWVEDMTNFPNAAHDDRVDAFSQAMIHATKLAGRLNLAPVVSNTRANPWTIDAEVR